MSEMKMVYELLNDLWNVSYETAKEPPKNDEARWQFLADRLDVICNKYEKVPRIATLASGMGACVYNYFCQCLKEKNNE